MDNQQIQIKSIRYQADVTAQRDIMVDLMYRAELCKVKVDKVQYEGVERELVIKQQCATLREDTELALLSIDRAARIIEKRDGLVKSARVKTPASPSTAAEASLALRNLIPTTQRIEFRDALYRENMVYGRLAESCLALTRKIPEQFLVFKARNVVTDEYAYTTL